MSFRHVAIVGGGYSGTVQAIELLRRGLRVTLIERRPRLARGVAYATDRRDHLLNVRASGMSAFADEPDHFAEWAARRGTASSGFAPRQGYGDYLFEIMDIARQSYGERLSILHDEAVAIEGATCLRLASGPTVAADAVILALGNLLPEAPHVIPLDLPDLCYVPDPWAVDLPAGLGERDSVLLIGTGLTAVDAALTLDSAGFRGGILALSRRGQMPRAHAERSLVTPAAPHHTSPRCTSLLRTVRAHADQVGWRGAVDSLRSSTQHLWAEASPAERSRFLRHLRPWWDVHRHRIAPEIAKRIDVLRSEQRLTVAAGRIVAVQAAAGGAMVTWRPRSAAVTQALSVRRIVNCTGPRSNILRGGETLLDALAAAGRIRPGPCRIGIDVDRDCRVIGACGGAAERLFAMGPLTRGTFWEIVAVPDIRLQAKRLAAYLGGDATPQP